MKLEWRHEVERCGGVNVRRLVREWGSALSKFGYEVKSYLFLTEEKVEKQRNDVLDHLTVGRRGGGGELINTIAPLRLPCDLVPMGREPSLDWSGPVISNVKKSKTSKTWSAILRFGPHTNHRALMS